MATTTPNFGWAVPTSTDLVKDGAVAIETLGDSIDASLVDLKGGTTGQVLAKASNTDMDFTWSAASGGSNLFYAGKNKMINGKFDFWQRGTSISLPNGSWTYGPDRFAAYSAFSAGTSTFSQQTFTPGAAPVAGYEAQYFSRVTCGSTATFFQIEQRLEDVRTFAGQTVTVSFWAKSSATPTVKVTTYQNFGTGGSSGVNTDGSNFALTSSWVRYTATLSIPSISGKTIGTDNALNVGLVHVSGGINSATIDTWGWQIEAGSTATDFQTATGTLQGELAACQRYYLRETASASYTFSVFAPSGLTSSTTRLIAYTTFPVQMRTVPSSVEYGGNLTASTTSGGQTVTSIALGDRSSDKIASVNYNVASGLTVNNYGFVRAENDATAYVGFSAEL
jgi:hypothetical protein